MKHFVKIESPKQQPQVMSISHEGINYSPVFLHSAIDQKHPVGNRKTFVEHSHDLYHLVIYTKGEGEYSMDSKFYTAHPGTCVLINPGQLHNFVSRRKPATYSEVTFSFDSQTGQGLRLSFESLLSLYAGTSISLKNQSVLPSNQMRDLHSMLECITDQLNNNDALSEYQTQHSLAMIFNYLIINLALSEEDPIPETPFERAKKYIETHYFDQISMDELAGIAGVSKGYFFRKFRQQFGISPLAHQQHIRIETAKTLLKTTSLYCNEIATRTGFSDEYFFHRIFKKQLGITPVQYRKKN